LGRTPQPKHATEIAAVAWRIHKSDFAFCQIILVQLIIIIYFLPSTCVLINSLLQQIIKVWGGFAHAVAV